MSQVKKKIVVLTGAGISAESGLQTFRDANGLWHGHAIEEVASPEGFKKNPTLVLDFYNLRRRQLLEVSPNAAHYSLVDLERFYEVVVITQNVDDLHERAGSTRVMHLHGELLKVRSTGSDSKSIPWTTDLNTEHRCENGFALRPDIVWFGEAVPMFEKAIEEISTADLVLVVGTSLQVYPAAGLMHYAEKAEKIYYVDPSPTHWPQLHCTTQVIQANAVKGVPKLVEQLNAIYS